MPRTGHIDPYLSESDVDAAFAHAEKKFPASHSTSHSAPLPSHDAKSHTMSGKKEVELRNSIRDNINAKVGALESEYSVKLLTPENIAQANSLKELALMIAASDGIDSPAAGHFSAADLNFLIEKVGKGEAWIEEITRELGLREKVYTLLVENGKQPRSMEHDEERQASEHAERTEQIQSPIVPQPLIPSPVENVPAQRHKFSIPLPAEEPEKPKKKGLFGFLFRR
jgi:hypothetical protein